MKEWRAGDDIRDCDSVKIIEVWKKIDDKGTRQLVAQRVGNGEVEAIIDGPKQVWLSDLPPSATSYSDISAVEDERKEKDYGQA